MFRGPVEPADLFLLPIKKCDKIPAMSSQIYFPYRQIFWIVIAVWWVAIICVVGWAWWIQPQPLLGLGMNDVMSIALASGGIAIAAIMPGWLVGVPHADRDAFDSPDKVEVDDQVEPTDRGDLSRMIAIEKLGNAFLVGMMIRLAGTVALFLASSYYLEASPETTSEAKIAAWILGWHLLLLVVEVTALSLKMRATNRSNSHLSQNSVLAK